MTLPFRLVTAAGGVLHVDLDDDRAHDLVAAGGDLNPHSLHLWRAVVAAHPWDVVVDVGVNYGEMLVGTDLPPSARVVGFEPNPAVRSLLELTLADNGLDVDLRAQAVADAPGTARFALDPHWSGMSSLAPPGESGSFEVEVSTLDLLLAELDPVTSFCVKVDVEGFEEQVLTGARGCRARPVPWVLMLETLHMPAGLLRDRVGHDALVLLRLADRRLVPVPAVDAEAALASGTFYGQDGLLVSAAALPLLLSGLDSP